MADRTVPTVEQWLAWSLSQQPRQRWVDHDGLRLNLREWGRSIDTPVVLIHGGAAHSHWWDHIAPRLASEHRVAAVDLSGHGDSSWRREPYRLASWAAEVRAVAETLPRSPVLIGHSLGGLVALKAAMTYPGLFSGAVVLDILAREVPSEEQLRRHRRASRPARLFDTRELAMAEFKTLPDAGPVQIESLVRYIAAHSVRRVPGGWSWKNDRQIFLRDPLPREALGEVDLPICLVGAGKGLLSQAASAAMATRLGPRAHSRMLMEAGHHSMLDHPVALTRCLENILRFWRGSA